MISSAKADKKYTLEEILMIKKETIAQEKVHQLIDSLKANGFNIISVLVTPGDFMSLDVSYTPVA